MEMKRRAIRESAKDFYTHEELEAWVESANPTRGREIVVDNEAFVAIADDGNRIIGLTNLEYLQAPDTTQGEIGQLYVDPDFGGRGVARALLAAALELAISHGSRQLQATASRRSEPVFAACGYEQVRRQMKEFNGHTYDSAIMMRQLPVGGND